MQICQVKCQIHLIPNHSVITSDIQELLPIIFSTLTLLFPTGNLSCSLLNTLRLELKMPEVFINYMSKYFKCIPKPPPLTKHAVYMGWQRTKKTVGKSDALVLYNDSWHQLSSSVWWCNHSVFKYIAGSWVFDRLTFYRCVLSLVLGVILEQTVVFQAVWLMSSPLCQGAGMCRSDGFDQ